jgi:hypothetical protein
MTTTAERRAAPRLAVKARSSVKFDGRIVPVTLRDISPSGARIGAREVPAVGAHLKLYLRSGIALTASVVRATEDGFAVAFDDAPKAVPCKTFFWKLESYVFASGAYAPRVRASAGRHLRDEALVETCTLTEWNDVFARLETKVRLNIGERIHVGGRPMRVTAKRGASYDLFPCAHA